MRNIVKYVGIVLVIIGILLVMKNLFSKETEWSSKKSGTSEVTYSVRIKLLDKESNDYLTGGKLVLKDNKGEIVSEWTTEGSVQVINKLNSGKYTLIEEEAPADYHLDEEGISFEIKNADKEITMYNLKMTDEEKEEERIKNTVSNEVGVDNTLSNKSILSVLVALVVSSLGLGIIYKVKKEY